MRVMNVTVRAINEKERKIWLETGLEVLDKW